jgi:hypothetical protein
MKLLATTIAILFLSTIAHADLLTLTPSTAASIAGVTLTSTAAATLAGAPVSLTTVGSALRWKVVLGQTNIYVGELLVSDPSRYVKSVAGALPSLENEQSVALVLHFVYNVPTFLVTTDFNSQARVNGISTSDPDIAAFMKVVSSLSFRNGGQFTMLFNKNADGTETLAIEDKLAGQPAITIPPVALSAEGKHKILALWLGVAGDAGLTQFQTDLMK